MANTLKICIVIPVFNHALTIGRVVLQAKQILPVIVVNDGSTDDTGAILAREDGIRVLTLSRNRGKGQALRAGFVEAERLGFSSVITIDADGQHAADEIPLFIDACVRQPGAIIVGIRDLAKANAPCARRIANCVSTFWFKLQTGAPLGDTQCGFRCYPLESINQLRVASQRYAFELELLVKAAWAGIPITAQPVSADYSAATSQISHFSPLRDIMQISLLYLRLSIQRIGFTRAAQGLGPQGLDHQQPTKPAPK